MKIGLLGMGTIGSGVFELAEQAGCSVTKVLEKRFQAEYIVDNIDAIADDPEIELVVETMGGLHPAYEFAVRALESGKHFVTANKLLVSEYGEALVELARQKGVGFLYGASCGGGIAYLANLEHARRINRIRALGGILNGTTNFILDAMQQENMSYAQALLRAQELGYAERDPSSDVDGLDTQRKLALACAVAFDSFIAPSSIPCCGIANVQIEDIQYARANDLVLRLCAHAEIDDAGQITAFVEPTLLQNSAPEASIRKNVNYAWYEGESFGLMSYSGQGAGKLPTAANVLRDVLSIKDGKRYFTSTACKRALPKTDAAHPYYLRLPKGAEIKDEWIVSRAEDDNYLQLVTAPLPICEVHQLIKQFEQAFCARLA